MGSPEQAPTTTNIQQTDQQAKIKEGVTQRFLKDASSKFGEESLKSIHIKGTDVNAAAVIGLLGPGTYTSLGHDNSEKVGKVIVDICFPAVKAACRTFNPGPPESIAKVKSDPAIDEKFAGAGKVFLDASNSCYGVQRVKALHIDNRDWGAAFSLYMLGPSLYKAIGHDTAQSLGKRAYLFGVAPAFGMVKEGQQMSKNLARLGLEGSSNILMGKAFGFVSKCFPSTGIPLAIISTGLIAHDQVCNPINQAVHNRLWKIGCSVEQLSNSQIAKAGDETGQSIGSPAFHAVFAAMTMPLGCESGGILGSATKEALLPGTMKNLTVRMSAGVRQEVRALRLPVGPRRVPVGHTLMMEADDPPVTIKIIRVAKGTRPIDAPRDPDPVNDHESVLPHAVNEGERLPYLGTGKIPSKLILTNGGRVDISPCGDAKLTDASGSVKQLKWRTYNDREILLYEPHAKAADTVKAIESVSLPSRYSPGAQSIELVYQFQKFEKSEEGKMALAVIPDNSIPIGSGHYRMAWLTPDNQVYCIGPAVMREPCPLLAHPTKVISLGKGLQAEIMPYVESRTVSQADISQLARDMNKIGWHENEAKPENIGWLNGRLLAIDPDRIEFEITDKTDLDAALTAHKELLESFIHTDGKDSLRVAEVNEIICRLLWHKGDRETAKELAKSVIDTYWRSAKSTNSDHYRYKAWKLSYDI